MITKTIMNLSARSNGAILALLISGIAGITGCGAAMDEDEQPATPPPPPAAPPDADEPYTAQSPSAQPAQPPPPPAQAAQPAPPAPPAAAQQQVYSYPTGQWIRLANQGWVWVPAGAQATESEGVPYTYLYTPSYGWTWYVSPWGWGPYRYGGWLHHPWHPVGMHGYWVARPHAAVRLGRGWHRR